MTPTAGPSNGPTAAPTISPSTVPTAVPTPAPTVAPSAGAAPQYFCTFKCAISPGQLIPITQGNKIARVSMSQHFQLTFDVYGPSILLNGSPGTLNIFSLFDELSNVVVLSISTTSSRYLEVTYMGESVTSGEWGMPLTFANTWFTMTIVVRQGDMYLYCSGSDYFTVFVNDAAYMPNREYGLYVSSPLEDTAGGSIRNIAIEGTFACFFLAALPIFAVTCFFTLLRCCANIDFHAARDCTMSCLIQPTPIGIATSQVLKNVYLPAFFDLSFEINFVSFADSAQAPYTILTISYASGATLLSVRTIDNPAHLSVQYADQFDVIDAPGFDINAQEPTKLKISISIRSGLFTMFTSAQPTPVYNHVVAELPSWEGQPFVIYASDGISQTSYGQIQNVNITGNNIRTICVGICQ